MPKAAKSDTEEKPKKEKKVTGEKKPITAYQQYMKDVLPVYKQEHPRHPPQGRLLCYENPNKGTQTESCPKPKKSKKGEDAAEKEGSDEIEE
ncbi:hypothetical protein BS47DRAFT_1336481 [Hydnum rufescens UP504]|uniref:Uncharacterized protein n=1 Tax=Hydnum rufescens UP504 TaxID=1448309 RepID=A0A9P6B956_9AGAM|nr:hypothetical protein BS47DRAFT_1336481 [Hydnum rufescens UP504]